MVGTGSRAQYGAAARMGHRRRVYVVCGQRGRPVDGHIALLIPLRRHKYGGAGQNESGTRCTRRTAEVNPLPVFDLNIANSMTAAEEYRGSNVVKYGRREATRKLPNVWEIFRPVKDVNVVAGRFE